MANIMVNGEVMHIYDFRLMLRGLAVTEKDKRVVESRWRSLQERFDRGLDSTHGRTYIYGVNGHKYTLDPVMEKEDWIIHNLICVLDKLHMNDPAYLDLDEELSQKMRDYTNNY